MNADHPLLIESDLPRFDAIKPEHVEPAMQELIQQAKAALSEVTSDSFPADWNQLSARLDVATEKLSRAWGMVGHLHAVVDTPELRQAYTQCLPMVTEFWTQLGSDERLYAKYKAIPRQNLNPEQTRALELALKNFVLSGAELTGPNKTRFAQIQERLAALSQQFSEHVLDATDQWGLLVSTSELDGVPKDVLIATAQAAQAKGHQGQHNHWLSLKMPVYLPVMQNAHSSSLREKLYKAHVTRASDQSELPNRDELDNTAVIQEILRLRHEEAQLLGFENHAQVSLATKMAPSEQEVVKFLRELAQRAKPYALRDVEEMRQFAKTHLGMTDPQVWDWTFVAERLKEHRYAFSEHELKNYFTAPKLLTKETVSWWASFIWTPPPVKANEQALGWTTFALAGCGPMAGVCKLRLHTWFATSQTVSTANLLC